VACSSSRSRRLAATIRDYLPAEPPTACPLAAYLRAWAAQHGFEVEAVQSGVIRKNGATDILGPPAVLRRALQGRRRARAGTIPRFCRWSSCRAAKRDISKCSFPKRCAQAAPAPAASVVGSAVEQLIMFGLMFVGFIS
jgi:hypothetical protein